MALGRRFTRRDALKAGGLGAGALSLAGLTACENDLEPRTETADDAPNVLLIVTDSTRRDFIGAYDGHDKLARTPNLDALAKQSLLFDFAVPEAMPTGAARRSILTGMRNFPYRDWEPTEALPAEPGWTPIRSYQPIFTEIMGEAGVETAYVTDNPFLVGPRYVDFRRTLDLARPDYSQGAFRDFNRPFKRPAPREAIERYLFPKLTDSIEVKRLRDYVGWNNLYRRSTEDYAAARVLRSAMTVLDELDQHQPFFLGVDAFDPHEALDPPRSYMTRFPDQLGSEKRGIVPIQPFDTPYSRVFQIDDDPETLERIRQLYSAELTFVDDWIGKLLTKMDDKGLLDNTVILYASDHGLTLGEYGLLGKNAAYPNWPIYRVPFMIRHPEGKLAGQKSDFYASTHDIGRTLLGFQGIRAPGIMDGEDLSTLFRDDRPAARPYFTAAYARYLLCGDERWTLIRHSNGTRLRLFDRDADPGELTNVADDNPQVVAELNRVLEEEAGGSLPQFGDDAVLGG